MNANWVTMPTKRGLLKVLLSLYFPKTIASGAKGAILSRIHSAQQGHISESTVNVVFNLAVIVEQIQVKHLKGFNIPRAFTTSFNANVANAYIIE